MKQTNAKEHIEWEVGDDLAASEMHDTFPTWGITRKVFRAEKLVEYHTNAIEVYTSAADRNLLRVCLNGVAQTEAEQLAIYALAIMERDKRIRQLEAENATLRDAMIGFGQIIDTLKE